MPSLTANSHILAHSTVAALAAKYRRTPEQVLLHYVTRIGVVPLTGTRSSAHMQDDLAIFDFDFDGAECAIIDALLAAA